MDIPSPYPTHMSRETPSSNSNRHLTEHADASTHGSTMSETTVFMDHWVHIDPARLARYETMYQWTAAAEAFYVPAEIGLGQVVADFGCALDVNAEFITRTRARAEAAGLASRVTARLLKDARLPLPDTSLDRIVARNTIIYVADPVATFKEFRRVLKPAGIAHAIESDWSLTAVEPLSTAEWRELVRAASWAGRTPEIGRKLHGIVRSAGFSKVSIQVLTKPDTDGRLLGMIDTVAGYARASGALAPERVDAALQAVRRGLHDGSYLAIAPQFLVTARADHA